MKTNYLILAAILLLSTGAYGQRGQREREYVEKKIGTEVYLFSKEDKDGYVKNKKNKIVLSGRCDKQIYVNQPEISMDSLFKQTFSPDRLRELASKDVYFVFRLYCDANGNIEEVEFRSKQEKLEAMSLEDIAKAEQAAKKCKYKLVNTCPEVEHYLIVKSVRFSKLIK